MGPGKLLPWSQFEGVLQVLFKCRKNDSAHYLFFGALFGKFLVFFIEYCQN